MITIAILISNTGTGTNLQAIINGVEAGKIKGKISAVVCDKPEAPGLDRAQKHNLPIEICPNKKDLLPLLQNLKPDIICLAGWKQIILDEAINYFPNKILNLHPGLIPDFLNGVVTNPDGTKGLWNKGMLAEKAIKNFFDKKTTYAGSSIHYLTLEFDFGPVLGRAFEKIEPEDTVESLYRRLKERENTLYVEVLRKITNKEV